MRRQVTESWRKPGRVDAVALHWPLLLDAPASEDDARAVRADAWRELEAMVDEGLVGCLGLSNFDVELMDEIIALARHRPVLNEVEVNPRCFQAELSRRARRGACASSDIVPTGLVGWQSTLPTSCPGRRRASSATRRSSAVAAEAGCTPAQACMAWAMAKGAAPIPKSLDLGVRATARCLDDVALTADQVARLDALRDPRRGVGASLAAHARIIASPDSRLGPDAAGCLFISKCQHSGGFRGPYRWAGLSLSSPVGRRGRIYRASRIAHSGHSTELALPAKSQGGARTRADPYLRTRPAAAAPAGQTQNGPCCPRCRTTRLRCWHASVQRT